MSQWSFSEQICSECMFTLSPSILLSQLSITLRLLYISCYCILCTTAIGLVMDPFCPVWETFFFFLPLSHLSKGLIQECRSWCMEEWLCTEPQEHHISMCRQQVNSPEALLWQNHKGYWSKRGKNLISIFQANWKQVQLGFCCYGWFEMGHWVKTERFPSSIWERYKFDPLWQELTLATRFQCTNFTRYLKAKSTDKCDFTSNNYYPSCTLLNKNSCFYNKLMLY